MKQKLKQIAQHPTTKKAFLSIKPEKTLWGILGVFFFFIAPEIVAYFWGVEITQYANERLLANTSWLEHYNYELLAYIFQDGISWFNLGFGVVLLGWLFF